LRKFQQLSYEEVKILEDGMEWMYDNRQLDESEKQIWKELKEELEIRG